MKLDDQKAIQVADLFRSLSDASRVKLIAALLEGEKNISTLVDIVGLSQSAVSHQMSGLRQMRVVRAHKVGRMVYYCLDDQHVAELFQMGLEHALHD